jgi:phospholipid-binding lipoprotein MlaA
MSAANLMLRPLLLCCLLLAACGTARTAPDYTLPDTGFRVKADRLVPTATLVEAERKSLLYVSDPGERLNRSLYNFNARVDRAVLVPVVQGYEFVLPAAARTGVSNFISNLNEVPRLANCALQGDQNKVNVTIIRLFTNTVLGVGGLFDVATGLGFNKQNEDFGQTLGVWGVPQGPYVVLPLYGPSSGRDTLGTAGDMVFSYYQMEYLFDVAGITDRSLAGGLNTGLRGVDTRAGVPFRYYTTDTPFEYDVVRFAYTQARLLQIRE